MKNSFNYSLKSGLLDRKVLSFTPVASCKYQYHGFKAKSWQAGDLHQILGLTQQHIWEQGILASFLSPPTYSCHEIMAMSPSTARSEEGGKRSKSTLSPYSL